jgi:hypothetical protein
MAEANSTLGEVWSQAEQLGIVLSEIAAIARCAQETESDEATPLFSAIERLAMLANGMAGDIELAAREVRHAA